MKSSLTKKNKQVDEMIAIIGKKVNTITNGIIKDGVILIDKGKIKKIGPM